MDSNSGAGAAAGAAAAHYDAAAAAAAADARTTRLRRAHNELKRRVLGALPAGARVLDLGCGRGGDLGKWAACAPPPARVLGLDASAASVAEARARAAAWPGGAPWAQFRVCRGVGERDDLALGAFDLVTCMFALHYFFDAPERAERALRFVRRHLRLGGRFVGVAPHGDRTRAMLAAAPGGQVRAGACTLRALSDASYAFALAGTVVAAPSEEPYLLEAPFRAACRAANLHVLAFRPQPPHPDFPAVFTCTFDALAV